MIRKNTKTTQPQISTTKTRGQAQCHDSFCHSTPEIPYNHHHNGKITNPTYYTACTCRNASYTSTGRPTSETCNHYGHANRKALQLEHMIDINFPYDNQHQYLHNPNITLNCQETAPIEQVRPVVNEASLLASVLVEQSITKSKFEPWITSMENAAQISGQGILWIAVSKIVGSPLTSAHRLRDCLQHVSWTLKVDFRDNIQEYLSTVMPPRP